MLSPAFIEAMNGPVLVEQGQYVGSLRIDDATFRECRVEWSIFAYRACFDDSLGNFGVEPQPFWTGYSSWKGSILVSSGEMPTAAMFAGIQTLTLGDGRMAQVYIQKCQTTKERSRSATEIDFIGFGESFSNATVASPTAG